MKRLLYEDVSFLIEDLIKKNNYKIGDKIPGDLYLKELFNVSRETIRRALNILVQDGLLERIVGKGTFIKKLKRPDNIQERISFSKELENLGYNPTSKVIYFNFKKNTRKIFNCNNVYEIHRIRYADNIPLAFEESYLPDFLGKITKDDVENSMYKFLSAKKNINYSKMIQEIKPVLISEKISKLLNIKKIPALEVTRLINNQYNVPFIYIKFILRGDLYSFKSEINL